MPSHIKKVYRYAYDQRCPLPFQRPNVNIIHCFSFQRCSARRYRWPTVLQSNLYNNSLAASATVSCADAFIFAGDVYGNKSLRVTCNIGGEWEPAIPPCVGKYTKAWPSYVFTWRVWANIRKRLAIRTRGGDWKAGEDGRKSEIK